MFSHGSWYLQTTQSGQPAAQIEQGIEIFKRKILRQEVNYGILAYFGVSPYAPRMIYRHFGNSSIAITHEYAAWFFFRSMLANCKIACHIDRKVLFTKRLERVKSEPMIDELL